MVLNPKKTNRLILILITCILLMGVTDDALAKKAKSTKSSKAKITKVSKSKKSKRSKKKRKVTAKRKYNPSKTKREAIEVLKTAAGLSPDEATSTSHIVNNFIDRQYSNMYETDRNSTAEDTEGEDLDELALEDNIAVDIDALRMVWMDYLFAGETGSNDLLFCGISKQEIMNNVMDWLGTPYLFGGTSRRAIDCSAFVRAVFQSSGNIQLPRTAAEQNKIGTKIRKDKMEFGDLVFFNTRRGVYVSHVGIYLGDNLFVHASSKYGVTISSLESGYYNKRLIGSKRLTQQDIMRLSMN